MEDTIPNSRGMYEYQYPRPAVTADVVVLSADKKEILLIRRKNDPYKGCWAFPGGFLNMDETLEQCARRELQEETSLVLADIHPVGTYSTVERDPRGRVITTAYYTSVKKEDVNPKADDDAAEIGWFSLDSLPPLAFDHEEILADAILLVRN